MIDRARSDARRNAREEDATRSVRGEATDQLAARAELQRNLASAVLELAEPYRSVVLRRYFDDQSLAQHRE